MEKENNRIIFAEERKVKILEILQMDKKIAVPEMCDYFGVSASTIRNDLKELEDSGLIKRTHGGAILASKTSFEPIPLEKNIKMHKEKKAIAMRAAELVEDGDTIAIDTGTTTLEFAKCLVNKKGITVILNDIQIARYLEDHSDCQLILLGGTIRRQFHYTHGTMNKSFLEKINVDKFFMTCNGFNFTKGVTTPDIGLAELKREFVKIASETILLCDSSKIGLVAFAQIVPVSSLHAVVTDEGIEEEDAEKLRTSNVHLMIANT